MKIRQTTEEQFEELHSVGIFVFADWGGGGCFLYQLSPEGIATAEDEECSQEFWSAYGYEQTRRMKASGRKLWKYFTLIDDDSGGIVDEA